MKDCREGIVGIETELAGHAGVGGIVDTSGFGAIVDRSGCCCAGVGGESSGGASGKFGGKGVESNEQHGGKVWRFEAVRRNGGTGLDSSDEELGLVEIMDSVVSSRSRRGFKSGRRTVGTVDCRVVVAEDCRVVFAEENRELTHFQDHTLTRV